MKYHVEVPIVSGWYIQHGRMRHILFGVDFPVFNFQDYTLNISYSKFRLSRQKLWTVPTYI